MRRKHNMKRMLSMIAAALLVSPAYADLSATTAGRIDEIFAGLQEGPGCSLGVYEQGKVTLAKGYGFANLEYRIPDTPDTVFDIASMSKQFTAMSIVLLAQDGKLGLDDDVRKYLPELRDYGTTITVRHLLNHTSGIRDFLSLFLLKGFGERDYLTAAEVFDILARQRSLMFAPGSAYAYSNSGYFLLSQIVERVSGMTLGAFAQERIFGPLGMKSSRFHEDSGEVVPNRAYAYFAGDNGYRVGGSFVAITGDGGVLTTVQDLQLWDEDFYQGKIWRPAVKAEMLRVNTLTNGQPVTTSDMTYYASGLEIGKRRGLPVVRHAGSWLGYESDFIRFPEQHFSVAVLCNSDSASPTKLAEEVADVFLEARYVEPEPKDDAEKEASPAAEGKAAAIPTDILTALPGAYYSADLDTRYVIEVSDGNVVFRIGVRRTLMDYASYGLPIQFLGDATIGNAAVRLKLHRDPTGKVTSFVLDAGRAGGGFCFQRIDDERPPAAQCANP